MILLVNGCVRAQSRTKRLADALLSRFCDEITEVRLADLSFPVSDEAFLQQRDALIAARQYDAPLFDLARQFAAADVIVVAVPFWDLSFPAALKQYIEQINVLGITFAYTPEGIPQGLCKAQKLFYVTTSGGDYLPEEYGFGYVRALAQNFYGISDVRLVKATGLDIDGADTDSIMQRALSEISAMEV